MILLPHYNESNQNAAADVEMMESSSSSVVNTAHDAKAGEQQGQQPSQHAQQQMHSSNNGTIMGHDNNITSRTHNNNNYLPMAPPNIDGTSSSLHRHHIPYPFPIQDSHQIDYADNHMEMMKNGVMEITMNGWQQQQQYSSVGGMQSYRVDADMGANSSGLWNETRHQHMHASLSGVSSATGGAAGIATAITGTGALTNLHQSFDAGASSLYANWGPYAHNSNELLFQQQADAGAFSDSSAVMASADVSSLMILTRKTSEDGGSGSASAASNMALSPSHLRAPHHSPSNASSANNNQVPSSSSSKQQQDLNPVLFSCLSELDEPKPLCWYDSADMTETHYFIHGDSLMCVWMDPRVPPIHSLEQFRSELQQQQQHHHEQHSSSFAEASGPPTALPEAHQAATNTSTTSSVGMHNTTANTSGMASSAPQQLNLPKMFLLIYSEKDLSHKLFLLDYIREKQENLTGDFYFKQLDAFEDMFGGEKADKIVVLQKPNADVTSFTTLDDSISAVPNAADASFSLNNSKNNSTLTLCFLINSTVVGFSLDLDSNGKLTYLFKIAQVHSMEMVCHEDGRQLLCLLQHSDKESKTQPHNDMPLQLAIYDEKYCLGSFDLQPLLEKYSLQLHGEALSLSRNILGLERLNPRNQIQKGYSCGASSASSMNVAIKIQRPSSFGSVSSTTDAPLVYSLNLHHLPPQTQLMQDIFQVFYHILPLQLYANLHHDFTWLRSLFNRDAAKSYQSHNTTLPSFNTQKSEWEIFFLLCCLNLGQDHLCFTISDGDNNSGSSHHDDDSSKRQQILNHLLNKHPDSAQDTTLSPYHSPIVLSSENDMAHLKSQLKSLVEDSTSGGSGVPHRLFCQHTPHILLSMHLLFENYRVYDASTSLTNQMHLLTVLSLFSRVLDMKNYILYYTCIYPDLLNSNYNGERLFDNIKVRRDLFPQMDTHSLSTSSNNIQLFSPRMLEKPPSIFNFLSTVARAARNKQRSIFNDSITSLFYRDYEDEDAEFSEASESSSSSTTESAHLYPFIRNCPALDMSRKLCRLYWNAFMCGHDDKEHEHEDSHSCAAIQLNDMDIYSPGLNPRQSSSQHNLFTSSVLPLHERIILMMNQEGIDVDELQKIGFGVSSVLYEALVACKKSPKSYWPSSVYSLIGRKDILQLVEKSVSDERSPNNDAFIDTEAWTYYDFSDDNIEKYHDDLEQQVQLKRFTHHSSSVGSGEQPRGIGYQVFQDKRLDQVWAMLSSSCSLRQGVNMCCTHPVSTLLDIDNANRNNNTVSDVEQLQLKSQLKQQLLIQILSRQIGRGLLTFSTRTINTTENIHIPPLVLKASLRRSRVNVDLSDQLQELLLKSGMSAQAAQAPTDALSWPQFHNGAAQTFSIIGASSDNGTHQQHITREWIVFHSPPKPTNENAGMLLALGLQGHLNALDLTDIYHCLRAQHELTSIAVLIGLSASKISSQDAGTTRTLSMHIPSLTSNSEIEIPANVQTASVMGLGLLYSGSSHRFITEVLFNELIRAPSDSSQNREGYSLAAGMALGLCTLAQGSERGPPIQLTEMNLDEKLYQYMTGGTRPDNAAAGSNSTTHGATYMSRMRASRHSEAMNQCTKIQESPHWINVDVTGPGACIALTLMYLQSHNRSIMKKLQVPDTKYLLEYLRPTMVLLRVVGRNLVGWNWIEPTEDWILENIPKACRTENIAQPNVMLSQTENEDWLRSVYANAIAGCCFALGIRYAGSGREDIYQLIIQQMQKLELNKIPAEKPLIHHCLLVCILSLSCIMSGRGNVDLVNIILSKRKLLAGQYDAQVALNLALGINFLGGGRCSFGTTPLAAASLLIALYPQFPSHFNDNQFHLQAFRHLYSLAAFPRLLEARDVDTGKVCHVPISISLKSRVDQQLHLVLPAIIPEKEEIESISINTPAFYSMKIDSSMMNRTLDDLVLWVRHRTSYLPQRHKPDQSGEYYAAAVRTATALNQSANRSMNISIMSTSSDGGTLHNSLLQTRGGVGALDEIVGDYQNERNITSRSPYENVKVLSSEFLSSKKANIARAVAYLSTSSELLWQSLYEDNMNDIFLHEYVKNAIHALKKPTVEGRNEGKQSGNGQAPNLSSTNGDYLTDQLWNLQMLIEHKLFDYINSMHSSDSHHYGMLNHSTNQSGFGEGSGNRTTETRRELEAIQISKYWYDKEEILGWKLESYFPEIYEYIQCESVKEKLSYLRAHHWLGPIVKFLHIYDLQLKQVENVIELKERYPSMPWSLVEYLLEASLKK